MTHSSERSRDRLLIVGWDGADWEVLEDLMARGCLPNVASMISEGGRADLRSTILSHSWAAWPSFLTGLNPGGHGVYDFLERHPDQPRIAIPASSRSIRAVTFLESLSRAGHEVRAGNIPVTFPPIAVRGRIISGVAIPPGAAFIQPEAFAAELDLRAPFPINGLEWVEFRSKPAALLSEAGDYIRRRTAAFEVLLEGDWSVAICVYVTPDRLQHALGRCLLPSHPDFDQVAETELAASVRSVYALLDAQLGRLRSLVGRNTTTVLMSDHGFRAINRAASVNRILEALGFYGSIPGARLVKAIKRTGFVRALSRSRLGGRLKGNRRLLGTADWHRTIAYESTAGGGISLNLAGREAEGIVPPGDYEEVRANVRAGLLSYRDPQTGVAPVTEVFLREETFSGPFSSQAPDLVAIPDSLWTFSHADVVSTSTDWPSGMHRQMGVLAAAGGRAEGDLLGTYDIEDLAPTVLSFCGEPVGDVDGKNIEQISGRSMTRARGLGHSRTNGAEAELSPEENRHIAEHLRDLGYIE